MPSAAQAASLQSIRRETARAGPPPCSSAAAFQELRGLSPGYSYEPVSVVQFQRGRLSLPA
eukprot:4842696-Alexandrium_andersonii.AAC.1